jgi:flagellar assembly protein FliH
VANSSEWWGALAAAQLAPEPEHGSADAAPGWLALLGDGEAEDEAFRPALPFAATGGDTAPEPAPEPALEPEPETPDPHAEALARAYADGLAAGRAAAAAEGEALARHQRALRLSFHTLDEAALGVLADDLAATVLALCDGVLSAAARAPAGLRERCAAAARRIGGAADALVLHLHPDDITMIGEGALAAWRLAPDEGLERGSLRIESPDGTVSDGPAEWRRAIAAAVRG